MIKDKKLMNKITKFTLASTIAATTVLAPTHASAQQLPNVNQVAEHVNAEINNYTAQAQSQAEQALIDFVGNGKEVNVNTTTITHNDNAVTVPVAVPQEVHNAINANTAATGVSTQAGVDTYGVYPVKQGNDRILNKNLQPGEEKVVSQGRSGVEYKADGFGAGQVVAPQNGVTEYNPKPKPKPAPKPAAPAVNTSGVWQALAQCESGGNPRIVSANGMYKGLYQFSDQTWIAIGGGKYAPTADQASPEAQTEMAQKLVSQYGFASQFPACSAKLGLR